MSMGDLDRVPGGERKALEQLAPGGDLARQRLAEARQLGIEEVAAAGAPSARSPGRRRGAGSPRRRGTAGGRTPSRRRCRARTPAGRSARTRSAGRSSRSRRPGSRRRRLPARSSARHIASPLPRTGPKLREEIGLAVHRGARRGRRSRRSRRRESASMTTTSSIAPAARSAARLSTMGPMVAASSRAGRHTETVASRSAARRSAGNSPCLNVRGSTAPTMASRGRRPPEGPLDAAAGGRAGGRAARRRGLRGRRAGASPSAAPRRPASRPAGGAGAGRASSPLQPPGRGAPRPPGRGRRSSPRAPRRASRCASTSPTLDVLCRDTRARALYLYPTKALAQDQARALHALGLTAARPAIYDGDTPREERTAIRAARQPRPHQPRHAAHRDPAPPPGWGDFFANLAVVVVDEAHVYRGVFGSHVGNVLRRLRRVANAYGTEPRFLLASATIANPVDLAERLTGLEDIRAGRPRRRALARAQDRAVEPAARSTRRWASGARSLGEASDLLAELVQRRRADDLLHQVPPGGGADHPLHRAAAGRGGARARRQGGALPRGLHARSSAGRSRAAWRAASCSAWWPPTRWSWASTSARWTPPSAPTFPGTVASLRQMWGRAGRREPRAGALRGGRGRARPVLLPPPRRVPGPPGGGGDPRPRVRGDPPGAPAVRRARGAAGGRRRRDARPALARVRRAAGLPGAAARARRALRAAPPRGLPGRRASRCARRPRTR